MVSCPNVSTRVFAVAAVLVHFQRHVLSSGSIVASDNFWLVELEGLTTKCFKGL